MSEDFISELYNFIEKMSLKEIQNYRKEFENSYF